MKLLGGIPLVAHSILHAINAQIDPENIIVSSDGAAILDVAREYGVQPCKRPAKISGDDASTEQALLHALDFAEPRGAVSSVLLLQPTSPIRLQGTLNAFIKFYLDGEYDSALTTTEFYNFFWREDNDGMDFEATYDFINRPMRQEMPPWEYVYFDNGNAYLTKTSILRQNKNRLFGNIGVYPIAELEGMQIDTPQDLELMRAIFGGLAALTGVESVP
jgi:N-acylneuraminate cytidylyltransferase